MLQFVGYIVARVGVFVSIGIGCFIAGQMSANPYWAGYMPYIAAMVGGVAAILFHMAATLLNPWQWVD